MKILGMLAVALILAACGGGAKTEADAGPGSTSGSAASGTAGSSSSSSAGASSSGSTGSGRASSGSTGSTSSGSGGSSGDSGTSGGINGTASLSGALAFDPVSVGEGAVTGSLPDGGQTWDFGQIQITDDPGNALACGAEVDAGAPAATWLTFLIGNGGRVLSPGSYQVPPPPDAGHFMEVSYSRSFPDAGGDYGRGIGTLTLSQVSPSELAGSFQVDVAYADGGEDASGQRRLSGTFTAPYCYAYIPSN